MKTQFLFGGLLALTVAFASVQGDEKKGDEKKGEKPAVGALPPHPLDAAFRNVRTEREINNNLLNNDLYKRAVKEALRAKQEQEARFKKNPKLADASPEQAARVKFLEVLMNEMKGEKQPGK